jgi:pimeloyl-ACP methyl ester carboxylesterase
LATAPLDAALHHIRKGTGGPLLLVHGLGSTIDSWDPIMDGLVAQREVIAVDLPGHGGTPPLEGEHTFDRITGVLAAWMTDNDLTGVDIVGSSMGARMVLELARRGLAGKTVALDPGGFWTSTQARVFHASLYASVKLVRGVKAALPVLIGNPVTRTALLAQFSAAPWRLDADYALAELLSIAETGPFFELLGSLAKGPTQEGIPAGTATNPITIVWGRKDRVTLPSQAATATARFPDAELVWIDDCGHFPFWDQPAETLSLLLDKTG